MDLYPRFGLDAYSIQDDDLQIGGAEADRIWYFFWRDKLAAISVSIKGFSNFKALKTVIFNKFGKGIQSDHSKDENYVWNGDITKVALYYSNDSYEGGLLMRSTEIQTQKDAYEAEQAKNRP